MINCKPSQSLLIELKCFTVSGHTSCARLRWDQRFGFVVFNQSLVSVCGRTGSSENFSIPAFVFETERPCIPAQHPFFSPASPIIFHFPLSPVLPLVLRLSVFLSVLLAVLTGFSKWPSEAAGLLPGAFGDLPGHHMPLSTLSSYGCLSRFLSLYKF